MKYKFKFEIDYSDMSKEDMRDAKLSILDSDIEMMESEVDPQIKLPIPEVGSIILVGNEDYEVTNMKYKIDEDYTVIFCLTSVKVKNEKTRDKNNAMLNRMSAMMSNKIK